MCLERGPQGLDPVTAPGRPLRVATAYGKFPECLQHCEEEPAIPNAFPLAAHADLVHSIVPIPGAHQGKAVNPELVAVLQGTFAMLVDGPRLFADGRQAIVFHLAGPKHRGLQECHTLVEQGGVACRDDVVVDCQRQEVQIVGDAGAHATAGRRVPPMLHVALLELPCGRAQDLRFEAFLWGGTSDQCHDVLKLVAKAECARWTGKRPTGPRPGRTALGTAASG